jgi:hypothetical protein
VERIDFPPALALILMACSVGKRKQRSKAFFKRRVAFNLAVYVADDAASLVRRNLRAFWLPPRVTVLSAVGTIRRNIWSEAQVLQCPQRAGMR